MLHFVASHKNMWTTAVLKTLINICEQVLYGDIEVHLPSMLKSFQCFTVNKHLGFA